MSDLPAPAAHDPRGGYGTASDLPALAAQDPRGGYATAPDLLVLAAQDPRGVYAAASALRNTGDPGQRVLALRALGLAGKELGRLGEGIAHLREALRLAESSRLDYAAAQVRMNLVGLLAAGGDVEGALAAADAAAPVLTGADADRLLANRAYLLARSGRIREVARIARTCADPEVLVGLRINTGLAKAYAGRLGRGEADLRAALATAERAGLRHQAAMVRHNLAFVAMRRGDLARALALYDAVEPELAGAEERLCQLRVDRAEALIAARLPGEARVLLADTIDRLTAGGYRCDTADALLLLAHAELSDGDPEAAAATARRARAEFADRAGCALSAELIGLRARWACGDRSVSLRAAAERAAGRLAEYGWASASADARTLAALVALAHGDPDHAEHLLGRVRGETVSARVAALHATALLRLARGDRPGASAAVRAGLRAADEHAAALGAAELRGRAAGWAAELADLGLRLATGPRALLVAAERARAIADRPPAVRPPRDRRLAALLAELRRVSAEVPARPDLQTAQGRLEDAVRARCRRLSASRDRVAGWGWLVPALAETLGDRMLAEYVRVGADLVAVTLANGRCRRRSLGPYDRIRDDVRLLRFAVSRLARDPGNAPARASLAATAGRLHARLIEPLSVGERSLVLAPVGALHGLPWAALPSLTDRPSTVVPSAAGWLRAMRAPSDGGHVALIAGPDLRHADEEIGTVRARHPRARVLTGAAAIAEETRSALDGASVAHVAAHGVFRSGNALFSGLRLADGPLFTYDLEHLDRPPRLLVLSACDAGRAEIYEGEAVIGMVTAALGFGTATVIAAVTPVGDAAARDLMAGFHERLAADASPAEALARAPRSAAALGFVCFGAGHA
ncbi:CHAT domain-containing protein [Actinoallomurus soli]|uniref:CHAT domain-containing protein n=1 Tax=Actinoallomurus soli TaxID=2952535 RepID=UPI002092E4DA|nr:CHAT domain-containing protein [Actinoallomurus soli]MCO5970740.1 CHAT domain-containing protein [Actinoallomurus soli]